MALATDHVRYLRGLAHALSPIVLIGNKGISDNLLDELKQALDRHELVKLRVLAETREERDQLVLAVLKHAGAELVQRVGHTATLYRQHPTKPKIALPGTRPKSLGTSARANDRSAGPRSQRADGAPAPAHAGHDGNMPFRRDADERPPAPRPLHRATRDPAARPARGQANDHGRFAPPSTRPGAPRFEREGAATKPFKRDADGRFQRGVGARPVAGGGTEHRNSARPGAARFGRDSASKPFRRDSTAARPAAHPARPGGAPRFERDADARPYRRDVGESSPRGRPAAGPRFAGEATAKPYSRERGERGPAPRPGVGPGAASRFKRDTAAKPFGRDTRAKSSRAVPGAAQRFERDAAAKPYRRGGPGSGVVRESVGAPRRERGELKPSGPGQRRAGGNPYSAWSGGADAKPATPREPAGPSDRPSRSGPGGARASRPPRPR